MTCPVISTEPPFLFFKPLSVPDRDSGSEEVLVADGPDAVAQAGARGYVFVDDVIHPGVGMGMLVKRWIIAKPLGVVAQLYQGISLLPSLVEAGWGAGMGDVWEG